MLVLTRNWWLVALRGLLAILFGITAFVWPGLTWLILILMFGFNAILDGIFAMISGLFRSRYSPRWWVFLVEGFISLTAEETRSQVEEEGRTCQLIAGDIGDEQFCKQAVEHTVGTFNPLDILVNNAAVQYPQENITDISADQLQKTFQNIIFSMFCLIKAAMPHLKQGSAIIPTAVRLSTANTGEETT
jgi:hypothetical protein